MKPYIQPRITIVAITANSMIATTLPMGGGSTDEQLVRPQNPNDLNLNISWKSVWDEDENIN